MSVSHTHNQIRANLSDEP